MLIGTVSKVWLMLLILSVLVGFVMMSDMSLKVDSMETLKWNGISIPDITNAANHIHPWLATCVSLIFLGVIVAFIMMM
jgi:hypothetical protein